MSKKPERGSIGRRVSGLGNIQEDIPPLEPTPAHDDRSPMGQSSSSPSMEPLQSKKPRSSFAEALRQKRLAPRAGVTYNLNFENLAIPANQFNPAESINTQLIAMKQTIAQELHAIEGAEPQPSPGAKRGYRFGSDESAVQSVADKLGHSALSQKIKTELLHRHARKNDKELVGDDGVTYYSPFVSLTESLPDFINTSFQWQHGDVGVKQDILYRALDLGTFHIPENAYVPIPDDVKIDPELKLSKEEKEFLFDTSSGHGGLLQFKVAAHPNPFKGRVRINFQQLLLSREFGEEGEQLQSQLLDRVLEYNERDTTFPKTVRLSDQVCEDYVTHLKTGEQLQADISIHPLKSKSTHDLSARLPSSQPSKGSLRRQQPKEESAAAELFSSSSSSSSLSQPLRGSLRQQQPKEESAAAELFSSSSSSSPLSQPLRGSLRQQQPKRESAMAELSSSSSSSPLSQPLRGSLRQQRPKKASSLSPLSEEVPSALASMEPSRPITPFAQVAQEAAREMRSAPAQRFIDVDAVLEAQQIAREMHSAPIQNHPEAFIIDADAVPIPEDQRIAEMHRIASEIGSALAQKSIDVDTVLLLKAQEAALNTHAAPTQNHPGTSTTPTNSTTTTSVASPTSTPSTKPRGGKGNIMSRL